MVKRLVAGSILALAMLVGACGGSDPAPPPAPATSSSSAISEADAITKAQDAAVAEGLSLEGLTAQPSNIFGEWQVSFEPPDNDSLDGGFLVVLEADTGEVIEVIEYR